uniref:Uncharacterized protein n=1 Tax=Arundo donax TaxID=35708 RepID=A0A0A9HJF0_ARUDO
MTNELCRIKKLYSSSQINIIQ